MKIKSYYSIWLTDDELKEAIEMYLATKQDYYMEIKEMVPTFTTKQIPSGVYVDSTEVFTGMDIKAEGC